MGIFDKVREVAADAKAKREAEQKALRDAEETRARHAQEVREAALRQAQTTCPLPVTPDSRALPGGLQLFPDEFVVSVGKDWGWSSQKLTLTTHRIIYSRGRLAKDQESVYLTDIRDIKFHKPLLGFGTLLLETAGGHSVEGLPAASNGQSIRDKLLQMTHYARQRAAVPQQVVQQVTAPQPDRYEQLKRAAELKDQGVLTADEFEAEKRRILDQG
ncbi:MAG: SHOCT domain-containing protein [Chloroflexota bacterium]|nr:SHOCT domain-containing protein [Chloroflexota bacterium]